MCRVSLLESFLPHQIAAEYCATKKVANTKRWTTVSEKDILITKSNWIRHLPCFNQNKTNEHIFGTWNMKRVQSSLVLIENHGGEASEKLRSWGVDFAFQIVGDDLRKSNKLSSSLINEHQPVRWGSWKSRVFQQGRRGSCSGHRQGRR